MKCSVKIFSPFLALPFFFLFLFTAKAQFPCSGGEAGGYPCNNIELLGHVSPTDLLAEPLEGLFLNDIWGWTDPETGKEYALVGMVNGTSFVDVSNPTAPVVLGILPEHHAAVAEGAGRRTISSPLHDGAKSIWRDIKVYQNHAFIVSEDEGHGVQIFDLTQLREPGDIPVIFKETANYQGISNAHNIVINTETGFAYAVGANKAETGACNAGGLHIIDIRDPVNPVFAGCYDADGYTHDAQCVIYRGPDEEHTGKEICFSSNQDAVSLVDVSDKENPSMISTQTYEGVGYVHQGWLTEDHRYFISNDEVDELNFKHNTRSYIWDMLDLDNPVLIGTYTGPNPSIDHNLYIHNGLIYESNYTSGLRVLSMTNIEAGHLNEVAYFDTYPADNERVFFGSWSNYPFFESGTIVVSDITNGLFILRLALEFIQEHPQNLVACLNGEASFSVETPEDNPTFQWQMDDGSGFTNLEENELYSQVNQKELQIASVTEEMEGNEYRVIILEEDGTEHISDAAVLNVTTEDPQALFEYRLEKGGVVFTNLSENASSFLWNFGEGGMDNTASPTYFFEEGRDYEVTLTAINGCGTSTYTQTISFITAIDEKEIATEFKVFPNPVKEILSIEIKDPAFELKSIRVFNTDGRELLKKKVSTGQSSFELDLSLFSKGVYFLQLISPSGVITRKVMVGE